MLKSKQPNKNKNSVIFYEGPSVLDGKPIVGILSNLESPSKNSKTGAYMVQTYIMRADISPLTAVYTDNEARKSVAGVPEARFGKEDSFPKAAVPVELIEKEDYSVCGNCPLKPSNQNVCYVNIAQAPSNIWKAYKCDRYLKFQDYPLDRVGRRTLRFGAYGDPTAIPFAAWQPLIDKFPEYTGYTHQWATCDRVWQNYLMASCETAKQREKAIAQGWRTTRITKDGSDLLDNEILCRNQAENIHCETCKLCDGVGKHGVDIVFKVHGAKRSHFATNF